MDEPYGYGRIIRGTDGDFLKIVEQKDATDEEQAVNEINSGIYIYNSEALYAALDMLDNDNTQGEYYLTDTISIIKKTGLKVSAVSIAPEALDEIRGVNTVEQLSEAEQIMRNRGV